ncbi:hypothetical protein [Marinithermofilum abyssi]|nr:hypothetical protein [Marinithermofilum abyssi]
MTAKIFDISGAGWTWYVVEAEEKDGDVVFFGYVKGFEEEWGYLKKVEFNGIPAIERDLHWTKKKFNEIDKI